MSIRLSKQLRTKHNIKSIPVRVGDEVKVVKGKCRDRVAKVIQVYRKKWVIHLEKVTRDKQNGN